jgi:outer membrane protein TolC
MDHFGKCSSKIVWSLRWRCYAAIACMCLVGGDALSALGQQPIAPELTLDAAITEAIAHNSSLEKARLETKRALADLAANRTKRYFSTSVSAQGAELLTRPQIVFPAGSLGTYSSTGPIPGANQTISIPRKFTGLISASASQPITNLIRFHFELKSLELVFEESKEDERKQKLETVDSVRRAYYAVVESQSDLDSKEASLPYYRESVRVATEDSNRETILTSDLLKSKAQLLQAENAVNHDEDQLVSAQQKLNDLMGRDIHTQFRVAGVLAIDGEGETQSALEARALQNRPDLKKARLDILKTDADVRAKRSEYIPELSGTVNYYTTFNFGSTLPSNITLAGVSLSWEPWDWGQKHQELIGKRAQVEEARSSASAGERSALMEVDNSWRQLQSARRQLALSEANQLAARQSLREVQEQAKREEKLPEDLFKAQSDLAFADSEYQKALTIFWKARADLKRVTGEE